MTTPKQRTVAVQEVEQFLKDLTDSKVYARVPKEVKEEAARLLIHYPTYPDLLISSQHMNFVWGIANRPVNHESEWEKP
jgi:tRNA U54 and U55 pseudouridine synthase Pus10